MTRYILTIVMMVVLLTAGYSQEETNNLQTIDLDEATTILNFNGSDKPLKNPERGYSIRAGVVDIKPQGYRNFTVRMYDEDGWNFFHEEYNDVNSKTLPIGNFSKAINIDKLSARRPYYYKDPVVGDFHFEFYAHIEQGFSVAPWDFFSVGFFNEKVERYNSLGSNSRKYAMKFFDQTNPRRMQIIRSTGGFSTAHSHSPEGGSLPFYLSIEATNNKYEIIRRGDEIAYYLSGHEIYRHKNVADQQLFLNFLRSVPKAGGSKLYHMVLNETEINHTDFSFASGGTTNFNPILSEFSIEVSTKGDNTEKVMMKLRRNSSGNYEVVSGHNYLSFDARSQSVTFNYPNQWANHYTDIEGTTKNSGYVYESMTDYYKKFAGDSISLMELESYVYFTDKQLEGGNLSYQNVSSLSEKINTLSKQNGVKLQLTLNSDFVFQNKRTDQPTGDNFDNFNWTTSREQGFHRVMDQINSTVYKDINSVVATAHLGWIYMPHDNTRYRDSNHWKNAFIGSEGQYYPKDGFRGDNRVFYDGFPINNYHGELRESVQKDDWHYHVLGGYIDYRNSLDVLSVNQKKFGLFRNVILRKTLEAFQNQKIILRSVMPINTLGMNGNALSGKIPYGYSDVAFGHRYGHQTTIGSASNANMKWGPNDSNGFGKDFGGLPRNTNAYSLRRYRNNLWNHGKLGAFESMNRYEGKTGAWINRRITSDNPFSLFNPDEFHQMINGGEQEEKAGLYSALKLRLFNYTSFDITKNNLLDGRNPYEDSNETGTTVVQRWKNETLDENTATSFGLTYSDGYFSGGNRSVYDYIRDHLGYRLEAKNLKTEKEGTSLNVTIEIQNKGFAAPQLQRKAYLVLLDGDNQPVTNNGELVQLELKDENDASVDWRDWQSTLFSNVKTKDADGEIVDLETNTFAGGNPSADCNVQNLSNTMENCLVGGIPLGRTKSEWYKRNTIIPQAAKDYYTYKLKATINNLDQLFDDTYKIALWLPDSNEDLKTRRDYAVKLANSNIETGPRGENILGQFTVDGPIDPGPTPNERFSIVALGSGNNLYQYRFEEGKLSDGVWYKIPGTGVDIYDESNKFQVVDMINDKNIVAVHLNNRAKHSYRWDGKKWNALPVITDYKENGSITIAHDGAIFAIQGHSIYFFNESDFEWVKVENLDPTKWPRNKSFHNVDAFSRDEVYTSDIYRNAIERVNGQMFYMTKKTTSEGEDAHTYEIAVGKDRSLWSSEYTKWNPSRGKVFQYDRENKVWVDRKMDDIRSIEVLTKNQIVLVDHQRSAYFWDGVNERIPLSKVDSEGNTLEIYSIAIGGVVGEPEEFNFGNNIGVSNSGRSITYSVTDLKNYTGEVSENEVLLYPNPIKNELQMRLNKNVRKVSVEIMSQTGTVVYQKSNVSVNNGVVSINNLGHLSSGWYILVVSQEGGSKISKIMIKE